MSNGATAHTAAHETGERAFRCAQLVVRHEQMPWSCEILCAHNQTYRPGGRPNFHFFTYNAFKTTEKETISSGYMNILIRLGHLVLFSSVQSAPSQRHSKLINLRANKKVALVSDMGLAAWLPA
jgi:hypothetical protein